MPFIPLASFTGKSGLEISFDPSTWHYDGHTLYSILCFYKEPSGKNRGSMVYGAFSVAGDYQENSRPPGQLSFADMLVLEQKKTRHHLTAAVKTGNGRPYIANYFHDGKGYWEKSRSASFLPLAQQAEASYPNSLVGFTDWMILI